MFCSKPNPNLVIKNPAFLELKQEDLPLGEKGHGTCQSIYSLFNSWVLFMTNKELVPFCLMFLSFTFKFPHAVIAALIKEVSLLIKTVFSV